LKELLSSDDDVLGFFF